MFEKKGWSDMMEQRCYWLFVAALTACFCCTSLVYASFMPYPSSAHYPEEGVVCAFYNCSDWNIKVLLLGESLTPWCSLSTASSERAVYPSASDPLLQASQAILPHVFKLYCVPLKQLDGIKIHIIKGRLTHEVKVCCAWFKDFHIFMLRQRIEHVPLDNGDVKKEYYLDILGFTNDELLHLGSGGVRQACDAVVGCRLTRGVQRAPVLTSHLLGHTILCRKFPAFDLTCRAPLYPRRSGVVFGDSGLPSDVDEIPVDDGAVNVLQPGSRVSGEALHDEDR